MRKSSRGGVTFHVGSASLIRFFAVTGLLAGIVMQCCSSPPNTERLDSEPDFVGFITAVEPASGPGDAIGQVAVESHAGKMVRRHIVRVTKQTAIVRMEGETTRPLDFGSLRPKEWVKVWFSNPVKKPYPLQLTARQLMVTDRP